MTVEIPSFVTMTGAARELRVCTETIRRRVEAGLIKPDGILVETTGRPGSPLFNSGKLAEIAATLTTKPN